jgi:hypothetical protein
MRDWLWEHHADVPRVRVLRADERASLGRWAEVREALAPCTGASFHDDEDHAQHFFHLRALAALHVGDLQGARDAITEATKHRGSCNLRALAAVLRPKLEAGDPGYDEQAPLLLTELVWAVQAADACLDAGDAEGALGALDPQRFRTDDEVQVLARRAEAWLRVAPASGSQRIAKVMTLAALVEAHTGPAWARGEVLPIPGATLDPARLDEVARRASAWLDAQGGEGSGAPPA